MARKKLQPGISVLPDGSYYARLKGKAGRVAGGQKKFPGTRAGYDAAVKWKAENDYKPQPADMTVGDWLTRWHGIRESRLAATTWYNDGLTIKNHILPHIGQIKLRDFTVMAAEDWLESMRKAGVKDSPIWKSYVLVKTALNNAVRREVIGKNPLVSLDTAPRKFKAKVKVSLTKSELVNLIQVADSWLDDYPYLGAMVRVGVDCACRPGELLGLRWSDYSTEDHTIWIQQALCATKHDLKETKTGASVRKLVVSEPTWRSLDYWRSVTKFDRPGDPIFSAPLGGHWQFPSFRERVWRPLIKAAGLPDRKDYGLYVLRHTSATLLLFEGQNVKRVSRRLGHAEPKMTMTVYWHLFDDDQAEIAQCLGKLFG